jgi:MFS family permease
MGVRVRPAGSGRERGRREPGQGLRRSATPARWIRTSTALLIGIQVLDGIGAGIFNVVSVLVIADLTRGTGRFNLTLGAISAAVGIGAALSQVVAGSIVHHVSLRAGFLFLAAVAAAAFAILYFFMPETRPEPVADA